LFVKTIFTAALFPAKPSAGQTGIKWRPGRYDRLPDVNDIHVARENSGTAERDQSSESFDNAANILPQRVDIVPRIGEPFPQGH